MPDIHVVLGGVVDLGAMYKVARIKVTVNATWEQQANIKLGGEGAPLVIAPIHGEGEGVVLHDKEYKHAFKQLEVAIRHQVLSLSIASKIRTSQKPGYVRFESEDGVDVDWDDCIVEIWYR